MNLGPPARSTHTARSHRRGSHSTRQAHHAQPAVSAKRCSITLLPVAATTGEPQATEVESQARDLTFVPAADMQADASAAGSAPSQGQVQPVANGVRGQEQGAGNGRAAGELDPSLYANSSGDEELATPFTTRCVQVSPDSFLPAGGDRTDTAQGAGSSGVQPSTPQTSGAPAGALGLGAAGVNGSRAETAAHVAVATSGLSVPVIDLTVGSSAHSTESTINDTGPSAQRHADSPGTAHTTNGVLQSSQGPSEQQGAHSTAHYDALFPPSFRPRALLETHRTDVATLREAAALLRQGQVVAMPTETVYGLAADAVQPRAVRRIFAAKRRPADNPLIVHVSSVEMLTALYPPGWRLPDVYASVVERHWPGPLTILLPRSPLVPDEVTCGQPTMAVRIPAHPVARALIALAGTPLAAPSANSSGRPSPTLADHVMSDLNGRIPMVIDGGPCDSGIESTVLDGLRSPPAVLRPGAVTVEQLQAFPSLTGLQVYRKDFTDTALEAAPTTPGMKYRHYSPKATVTLLDYTLTHTQTRVEHTGQQKQQERWDAVRRAAQGAVRGAVREAAAAAAAATAAGIAGSSHSQDTTPLSTLGVSEPCGASVSKSESMSEKNVSSVCSVGVLRTTKGPHAPSGLTPGNQHHTYLTHTHDDPTETAIVSTKTTETAGNGAAPGASVCVYEYVLGDISDPAAVAQSLFRALRLMDELGVVCVVVEGVCEEREGLAVMNRVRKAASHVVTVRVPL